MKVGLLADIHGNSDALTACLGAARQAGVERLLIVGDLVGYYYAPDEVLEQLSHWDWTAVRGNHEDMLAEWRAGGNHKPIYDRYGSGLAAAIEKLNERQLDQLNALPLRRDIEIGGKQVVLFHGTPTSVDTYVYPDAPEEDVDALAIPGADIVVCGHTHYPNIWRTDSGHIVNPGSVGQPRNRQPGAHWALWDSESGAIDLRIEAYDTEPLATECRRRDPHLPYLANVLSRR